MTIESNTKAVAKKANERIISNVVVFSSADSSFL